MNEKCIFMIVDLGNGVEVKGKFTDTKGAEAKVKTLCYVNRRKFELWMVIKGLKFVERLGYYTWNARRKEVVFITDWKPLRLKEAMCCNDDISTK